MRTSRAESGLTEPDFDFQKLLHFMNAGKERRLWVRDATLRQAWESANFTDYNCLLLDWCARASLNTAATGDARDEYLSRIVMAMAIGMGELARVEGRGRVDEYKKMCASLKVLGRQKAGKFDAVFGAFFTSGWASSFPSTYRAAGLLLHYHFNSGSQFAGAMDRLQMDRGSGTQESEAWGANLMKRWVNVNDVERLACVIWKDRQVAGHFYSPWSALKDKGCNCSTCTGQGGWRNPSGG